MSKGLTLVELLIVIGVVAVLSTITIITMNPAQFLRETRDSARLADLTSLNRALSYVFTDSNAAGNTTTVYISIPDPSNPGGARTAGTATACGGITGLPELPAGWVYNCVGASDLQQVNGSGWLPVAFSNFSGGSLFSSLPIDPVNESNTLRFYTYARGTGALQGYLLTGTFESRKYLEAQARADNGYDPARIEIGSAPVRLWGFVLGLISHWKFEEGSGTALSDAYNANPGTLTVDLGGSQTTTANAWSNGIPGKVANAVHLDGFDDYIRIGQFVSTNITLQGWFYWVGGISSLFRDNTSGSNGWILGLDDGTGNLAFRVGGTTFATGQAIGTLQNGWHHFALAKTGGNAKYYLDGVKIAEVVVPNIAIVCNPIHLNPCYLMKHGADAQFVEGKVDEFRVYGRELTSAEIQAYYFATN